MDSSSSSRSALLVRFSRGVGAHGATGKVKDQPKNLRDGLASLAHTAIERAKVHRGDRLLKKKAEKWNSDFLGSIDFQCKRENGTEQRSPMLFG